jgi:glucoamylase
VTVTGRTAPGADVSVSAAPTDVAGLATTTQTRADRQGAFSATVALGFGTNVVTVGVAKGNGTGYARVAVVSTALPGTLVLGVDDPSGDDHGPGTYTYPTSGDFHPGAFDLTQFQVIDAGATIYLRAELRDLTPTFGSPLGAQLLDVFVRDPGAGSFSTAPPFGSRNFQVAPDSAWSSRVEVQGFADPVFVNAGGQNLGPVTVTANQATGSILIAVPSAALGHPAAGWTFTVALHGQDGFSGDQARGFQPTAQPFQFGLCAPGGTSPICGIDPNTAPKVIDTVVPSGVTQEDELNPIPGPATLHGVLVP